MTVDFDNYSIIWQIDQRKIGELQSQESFLLKNQLHFNIAVRDEGIKLKFSDDL